MKKLNEYIKVNKLPLIPLEEKLRVNKNYKEPNNVQDMIDELFDNPEYDDIEYDSSDGRRLVVGDIIDDMLKINFDGYSRREQIEMYNKIVTSFKVLPKDIYASNYTRAIKKSNVSTQSKYDNLVWTLFKEFTQQETSTSKCCSLDMYHAMYLMMSDKYMMFFLVNTRDSEVYGLFMMEFAL